MPGKFINEITSDTPAKDDLAVFFDKSKNSTAQATIAEMVNAGLDLAAGAKGQVPTIDVKVDAATSSLVNILTWGAGGGVDFKGTPTRPPTGTDEILTNDPANGLIGKTTLQQLVVAGGATILQPGTAVNTALAWNDTAGKWEPARAVSEAKNINGGATGELPFQLNTHVTAWIPLGNAGQVLTIGDIGTAGNSFIAPMWNDPVKELPTFTIADKGKQLTVKSDGKATEWVQDAKELPTFAVADASKVLSVKADGTGAEWVAASSSVPPFTATDGGSLLVINAGGTAMEWRGFSLDSTHSTSYVKSILALSGAAVIQCPTSMDNFSSTSGTSALTSLTLMGLQNAGTKTPGLQLQNCAATLTRLLAPQLLHTYQIRLVSLPELTELHLPSLTRVFSITIASCPKLATVEIGYVNFPFDIHGQVSISATAMTSFSLNAANLYNGISITNNTSLATFNFQFVRQIRANVNLSGNAIVETQVNTIFNKLVAMNGTGSTPIFGHGQQVNLSGGTNAAPTGQGIIDAQALIARGCTVTVNGTPITTTKKFTLTIPDFDTVADKGKSLKVKADGSGLEWVV